MSDCNINKTNLSAYLRKFESKELVESDGIAQKSNVKYWAIPDETDKLVIEFTLNS